MDGWKDGRTNNTDENYIPPRGQGYKHKKELLLHTSPLKSKIDNRIYMTSSAKDKDVAGCSEV